MDIRVLKSLITCALYPHLTEDNNANVNSANGAEQTDEVATAVLNVPYEGRDFFAIGFNLALECAARIVSEPLQLPDLSDPLHEAKNYMLGAAEMTARHVYGSKWSLPK